MQFASDNISIAGGVGPIGIGVQYAAVPLIDQDIAPEGNFDPSFGDVYVARRPFERPSERSPGIMGLFLHLFRSLSGRPEPTRKDNIATPFESVPFLSGLPGPAIGMPVPSALSWEAAPTWPIGPGEDGNYEIATAWNPDPATVINAKPGQARDDISKQIQDWPTNAHQQLFDFKTSFPSVPVKQSATTTRSVVLAQIGNAGNFVGEMNLPDGTVAARIAWTNKAQNDLWASFGSQAQVPQAANQPGASSGMVTQSSSANDGPILNPDDTKFYLVKGKRAISFSCPNACTVNVEIYNQA